MTLPEWSEAFIYFTGIAMLGVAVALARTWLIRNAESSLAKRFGDRAQDTRPVWHWFYALFCYAACGVLIVMGIAGDRGLILLGVALVFTSTYAIFFGKGFNPSDGKYNRW